MLSKELTKLERLEMLERRENILKIREERKTIRSNRYIKETYVSMVVMLFTIGYVTGINFSQIVEFVKWLK